MSRLFMFSGPCGCGKSTLADAYANHLVQIGGKNQVYVIHGDNFHDGFAETENPAALSCPDFLRWEDILRFNWDCMLTVAQKALDRGLDVLIDYVVEDELPLLQALASKYGAKLYYTVLTASEDELRCRLISRGDPHLIERSLFLKKELETTAGRYLFDISGMTVEDEIEALDIETHEVPLDSAAP
jgi:ribose 1,5-bisphosphokinase PhnN